MRGLGHLPCHTPGFTRDFGLPEGRLGALPFPCLSPRAAQKLAFLCVLKRFQGPARCGCLSPRTAKNSRFAASSRVFKALPPRAIPSLLNASRVSQTNRANSRREPQTFRKASSSQGIQGGGQHNSKEFLVTGRFRKVSGRWGRKASCVWYLIY